MTPELTCRCGHGADQHAEMAGGVACLECPCDDLDPDVCQRCLHDAAEHRENISSRTGAGCMVWDCTCGIYEGQ